MALYNHVFLEELAEKSLAGEADVDELQLLLEILEGSQGYELQDVLNEILDQDRYADCDNKERVRNAVDKRILNGILNIDKKVVYSKEAGHKLHKPKRFVWYKAAVILLVLGLGVLITLSIHKGRQAALERIGVVQPVKEDIVPGKDKAILTLANGRQIVLDSAGNGIVANEGGVDIQKVKNGQLIYTDIGSEGLASNEKEEVKENTIITPRGGKFSIVLPDGTKVWLNSDSKLSFPTRFVGDRVVRLEGEAYFEVTKAPNRPFKVMTRRNMEVRVLGTHFNVMAYADENVFRTTLLEGAVEVKNKCDSVKIKPGEQAVLTTKDGFNILDNVDLDQAIAWKNGLFYFDQKHINIVMDALSRWYDIEVVYSDKAQLSNDLFSAIVNRNNDIRGILRMLEATEKVKFEIKGRTVKVLPGLNN